MLAAAEAAAGPGQTNQFQVYPFFSGTDQACTGGIYLLPPSFVYGKGFAPFSVPLRYVGSSTQLPVGISGNADFTLGWSAPKSPPFTQSNVSVQVTITGTNAWSCAAVARQTLMANFTAFLLAVEALELAGSLLPGSAGVIGSRVADQMPAPLAETLFWRYGLSPGLYPKTIPYVDVRPGMRLRVDTSASQFVNPGAPQNFYVAGPQVVFPVGSTGGGAGPRLVTFDALLAAIKAPTVQPPPQQPSASSSEGAAGALDLEPTGGRRAYWRLIYPGSVPSPYSTGDLSIVDNVVLLGAATRSALEAATAAYPDLGGGNPPNVTIAFLGRSLVVPEIPVFVSLRSAPSQGQWVPVGTTLANLIEQFAALPTATTPSVLGSSGFLRPTAFSPSGGTTAPVTLTTTAPSGIQLAALPPAIFDVPLIAGDGISLVI